MAVSTTVINSFVYAQDSSATTVRLRLLSNNNSLSRVTLRAYGGLRISAEPAKGDVTLIACGNAVEVRDSYRLRVVKTAVNLASRAGRWIQIDRPEKTPYKTVGWIQVSSRDGKLQIVNVLPMETYVLGIVETELGSLHFNPESLKAQIVASRSYVLASRGRHRKEGYDFCDTPHCQAFAGTSSIQPDYKLAMQISRGIYLAYKGKPIPAFFHDNCGGRTASIQDIWKCSALPYLQGVSDGNREDPFCQNAPRAEWQFRASGEQLRKCFRQARWMAEFDALDTLRVIRINASNRANEVLVQSNKPRWVPAREFRLVVNKFFKREALKSTYFTITKVNDNYEFNGRGWGHGVGLCQWGAIEMAREGYSYKEILAHYYPGTTLQRLPELQYAASSHDHNTLD